MRSKTDSQPALSTVLSTRSVTLLMKTITLAEGRGLFSPLFVSVCALGYLKVMNGPFRTELTKFFGGVGRSPRTSGSDFGDPDYDPDLSFLNSDSFKASPSSSS